jgi:predicted NBD/HSP70 family sugar kinase
MTSPMLGLLKVPLATQLEERLGLPVLIDNDVNTLAVAERLYGRGRDVENFATVTLGRGVGLGLVVGGELYRGRGGAGELGHLPVDPDGPVCECGNRGCLEALVADPALVACGRALGLLGLRQGIERLRELAAGGDPEASAIFADAGETLGRAVASLVNLLDPQLVLVSGEGIASWPYLERSFGEALAAATFGPLRGVPVEVDPWDDAKWACGAAALVLRAPFTPSADAASEDVRDRLHRRAGAAA